MKTAAATSYPPCAWSAGLRPGTPESVAAEIRNPKSEIRRKSEARNPNCSVAASRESADYFCHDATNAIALPIRRRFLIPRLSDFGFRISFGFFPSPSAA